MLFRASDFFPSLLNRPNSNVSNDPTELTMKSVFFAAFTFLAFFPVPLSGYIARLEWPMDPSVSPTVKPVQECTLIPYVPKNAIDRLIDAVLFFNGKSAQPTLKCTTIYYWMYSAEEQVEVVNACFEHCYCGLALPQNITCADIYGSDPARDKLFPEFIQMRNMFAALNTTTCTTNTTVSQETALPTTTEASITTTTQGAGKGKGWHTFSKIRIPIWRKSDELLVKDCLAALLKDDWEREECKPFHVNVIPYDTYMKFQTREILRRKLYYDLLRKTCDQKSYAGTRLCRRFISMHDAQE